MKAQRRGLARRVTRRISNAAAIGIVEGNTVGLSIGAEEKLTRHMAACHRGQFDDECLGCRELAFEASDQLPVVSGQ